MGLSLRRTYAKGSAKRIIDLLIAVPGLIVASPIVLIAVTAIALTSRGSPIFAQNRVGRSQSKFRCYKLRTMAVGTASVPTHESNPAAITPIGKLLRATKLDELPQLWNVARGEMSLVGPRPCLPTQVGLIAAREREGVFDVRPGMTGLAQVRGIDMSTPTRLAGIDGSYVRNATLCGDVRILIRTVVGRG